MWNRRPSVGSGRPSPFLAPATPSRPCCPRPSQLATVKNAESAAHSRKHWFQRIQETLLIAGQGCHLIGEQMKILHFSGQESAKIIWRNLRPRVNRVWLFLQPLASAAKSWSQRPEVATPPLVYSRVLVSGRCLHDCLSKILPDLLCAGLPYMQPGPDCADRRDGSRRYLVGELSLGPDLERVCLRPAPRLCL